MTDDRRPADPPAEDIRNIPLHTPPDFDAPAFPDLIDAPRGERDPERGQHLVWVFLALIIAVIAWWGF